MSAAPRLTLRRFASCDMGTFGRLSMSDTSQAEAPFEQPIYTAYTVERPWLDNARNISCIPAGQYLIAPRRYHRGKYDAYEVLNVPDRTHILFHVGNTPDDLAGCIAPGERLGAIRGKWAVTSSKRAFGAFMAAMDNRPGVLAVFDR